MATLTFNNSLTNGNNSYLSCSTFLALDTRAGFPTGVLPYVIAIATLAINAIATPLIFYINILIFWTICKDQRLRSASYNVLLAGLALNDLFVGVVVQPTYLIFRVCSSLNCPLECRMTFAYAGVLIFFTSWSLNTLMILSLERYLSIHFPLSYNAVVTNNKVRIATILLWVCVPISMLLAVLFASDYIVRKVLIVLVFGSNVVVTVFTTVKVHQAAHRQRRSVAIQQAAVHGEEAIASKLNESKRAFTIATVVVTTVGLYCPLIAAFIGISIKGHKIPAEYKTVSISIGATFVHMQSLINPLILSLRLSLIREGVKRKLCCCK